VRFVRTAIPAFPETGQRWLLDVLFLFYVAFTGRAFGLPLGPESGAGVGEELSRSSVVAVRIRMATVGVSTSLTRAKGSSLTLGRRSPGSAGQPASNAFLAFVPERTALP
jgi:hypothetical protein